MGARILMAQLPNVISVLRLLLIVPIAYGILDEHWEFVLIVLVAGGITDLLDGYIARRFHWTSRLGEVIDPIADKVTFGGTCVMLTLVGLWPAWLLIVVLAREVIILGGAGLYRLIFKQLDIEPTLLSKVNTTVLVTVVGLVVISQVAIGFQEYVEWVAQNVGYWAVTIFAVASGLDYVRLWSFRAVKAPSTNSSTGRPTEHLGG